MTPEKQRIAIAEACGWKINKRKLLAKPPNDSWQYLDTIPDYLNDLNAMHEAEKILTAQQRRSYVSYIFNLPASECESNTFATAAQRAKAFLRTLNLWEE